MFFITENGEARLAKSTFADVNMTQCAASQIVWHFKFMRLSMLTKYQDQKLSVFGKTLSKDKLLLIPLLQFKGKKCNSTSS